MNYKLPHLNYNYNALEPYIDERTMEIHYTKHHQTYVNNLNMALKNSNFINMKIEELVKKLHEIENNKRNIVKNNAGGHLNHSIFWENLKKNTILKGNLKKAINIYFKNFNTFQIEFENVASSHFGSGWVWLIKKNNVLKIVSTKNQDNPMMGENISKTSGFPIFGIDLWEHAYYLHYQNRKIDYIKAFWNVVNWENAEIRFNK